MTGFNLERRFRIVPRIGATIMFDLITSPVGQRKNSSSRWPKIGEHFKLPLERTQNCIKLGGKVMADTE